MRLGDLEQRILLACLSRHQANSRPPVPDVWRSELPSLLWGWRPTRRHWHPSQWRYPRGPDYQSCQASLTRALSQLYDKGLIRMSYVRYGWQEPVYNGKGTHGRAKSLRLTPLGTEIAFLRIPWRPRRGGILLTPIYGVKSPTVARQRSKSGYAWLEINL
jgi:hypothetical protein